MATFDFNKLGLDRLSTSIGKSVGSGNSGITTGDITKGEVVDVTLDGETPSNGSATVTARRTGAIFIGTNDTDVDGSQNRMAWGIDGTTLTVRGDDSSEATLSFWVF